MKENKFSFFGKQNYLLMAVGVAFILIGFILMIEKGSTDPTMFNEAVYSPLKLTISPLLILTGFIIEFFAIFKQSK